MKGLGTFDKILMFISVKEILLYIGKSPLEAGYWNCPLSVNPLMISSGQEYRSLKYNVEKKQTMN